ncbi:tigger transposable element-derived protein 6-like protein [Dinothrombium tinctorium]|uniref:Tigger transposable element-derived protein 6-like protein n=1 Tax=Dinothrombium tinctorium TaxID=1965070 RepID=A0A443Q7Y6_9ACAR|nr:tigger transposable element-derived protein 6-like protein [Dinothrombium tinctorium]
MDKKRKFLTLEEKIQVIEKKNSSLLGIRALAEEFGCGRTQINNFLKNQNELIKQYEEFKSGACKKLKPSRFNEKINEAVFEFFLKARSKNIPISGPMLQSKAREFAEAIGENFSASNGWLEKFRRRNNIVYNCLSGESADVCMKTVQEWKERVKDLCKGYSNDQIYNCDKTGLFWRAIPSKSLQLKGDRCSKGKSAKQRITVLLCTNLSGSEKKKL